MASFEALLASVKNQVPGWTMLMMRFPPRPDAPVAVSIMEPNAPHPFARSQLTLNRASAEVLKWEPYAENSSGKKLRTETLLSNILEDGIGGLARELHQLADELNRLGSTRETPEACEPSPRIVGLSAKAFHPWSR